MRIEDLDSDRCDPRFETSQLADLAAIGIDWDGEVERQSEHIDRYQEAVERLTKAGLTYPCFCTRADRAASAPHGSQGSYSGKCSRLTAVQQRELLDSGRRPSLRARLGSVEVSWVDGLLGERSGVADDPIVRRADGVFAYNLAVVIDDHAKAVDQVVRGADLAHAVPVQAGLCDALGIPRPQWIHAPLVTDHEGNRLAKRDGGTTLAERKAAGQSVDELVAMLGASLGLCGPGEPVTSADLLNRFDSSLLPHSSWALPPLPKSG
jgi:glutamyl-tRNA synthetase